MDAALEQGRQLQILRANTVSDESEVPMLARNTSNQASWRRRRAGRDLHGLCGVMRVDNVDTSSVYLGS